MSGLGDLDGGDDGSVAYGTSADGSVIVGWGHSTSGPEGFRWESNTMSGLGDLSGGGFYSWAKGVSGDGSIVVGWGTSEFGEEAFRWEAGVMTPLGDLAGGDFDSEAKAVSADGSTIVGRGTTAAGDEAFIWDATNSMRNLRNVLVNDLGLDLTDWTLSEATGVSADGQTIVGIGINPSGDTEGWIARLPEPNSLTLVLLFGLPLLRRRR